MIAGVDLEVAEKTPEFSEEIQQQDLLYKNRSLASKLSQDTQLCCRLCYCDKCC